MTRTWLEDAGPEAAEVPEGSLDGRGAEDGERESPGEPPERVP